MLDQQKDWTFKLFLHNFFKENNLKNTLTSFENEVLQTPNFNQNLPIKSNRTFLLEWWNIFFHLYSEKTMNDFSDKHLLNYSQNMLKTLSFADLFRSGVLNTNIERDFLNNIDINNILSSNQYLLSTLESFKNISRSFNNMNFPFNNVNPPNIDLSNIPKNFANFSNINMGGGVMNNMNNINNFNNLNSINNFSFQKENSNLNKYNSDTSSISFSSDNKNVTNSIKETKIHQKLFNTNHIGYHKNSLDNDFSTKKRKRYIKNNKFVYVHPGSAAAKKMELEKEMDDKIKDDDLIKAVEPEEFIHSEINNNFQNNSNDQGSSTPSHKGKKPRGSRYRGVSRNGNQWQVLIMVNKKKRYVGSYSNEEEAARAYDKVALQNHGTKAKTNFDYIDEEVKRIILEPPLLKIN